ncbi:hypothetical protein [Granulicella sibirica]|uniref:Right handed beta helix domain-containing protein n=1 Tax=Granulicella sibirica TaxID=2479048 RepID=A0A4V1L514_9BACT|nr:hypothetical protein [Granulicella sibirica]RXH54174.1 hypothetical protein GRAN_4825 [Granulicella sibirica]
MTYFHEALRSNEAWYEIVSVFYRSGRGKIISALCHSQNHPGSLVGSGDGLRLCFYIAVLAFFASTFAHATVFYVNSKDGNDARDGKSPAAAFKTLAKINTITPLLEPGDEVLLHAGYRYTDDYIRCESLVGASVLTTLSTNPPSCSGSLSAPVTFSRYSAGADPIIDAADPLTGLVWRSLGDGVYSTPLATVPQKLYVDELTETPQLVPVPNFVGDYDGSGATTYQPWDAVYDTAGEGQYWMNGGNTAQGATLGVLGLGGAWGSPYAATSVSDGSTAQVFLPKNTGLENVKIIGGGSVFFSLYGGTDYPSTFAFSSSGGGSVDGVACDVKGTVRSVAGKPLNTITYTVNRGCSSVPAIKISAAAGSGLKFFGRLDGGSFYYASRSQNGALAHELYVHLADGSNPNDHVFYATHRPYGVLLRGVNNVNVTHIQFAHQLKSGILSYPFASSILPGKYWTNENIKISYATCWNTGDTVYDTIGWQGGTSRTANLEACVVLRASGDLNPHLVRGNSITDSWSGFIDSYYGSRGNDDHANFELSGLDGTQTINGKVVSYPVIQYSYGRSHNTACIRYGVAGLTRSAYFRIKGGIVRNNECTDNAIGNIFFGETAGGQVSQNFIHDSLGEGIQGGGFSTSVADSSSYEAQIFDHNIISNLGFGATLVGYNGIDLNNGFEGIAYPYTSDIHLFNNTIVNTAAACVTMEMNIVATHMHDNVCIQASNYYPSGWMCPNCSSTMNYSAGVYLRRASLLYGKPMDWHNNAWQSQYVPEPSWIIYNTQGALDGSCSNLVTWPSAHNSSAVLDHSSFCTATPEFNSPTSDDFRLTSSSPLRRAGTDGIDIGAIPYGKPMFTVGPRL